MNIYLILWPNTTLCIFLAYIVCSWTSLTTVTKTMVQLETCDTWKLLRVNTQKIFIEYLLCTPMRWLFFGQIIMQLTIKFSVYYSLFKTKCLWYHHGTSLLNDWLPWLFSWRFPYKEVSNTFINWFACEIKIISWFLVQYSFSFLTMSISYLSSTP